MDRILVAYGSKHGATVEIAEAIGAALTVTGFDVDVERARDVRSVEHYRAVVLGSAVYMGRWRSDALRLLRRRRRDLAQRDVWIFSSGPIGEQTEDDPDGDRWLRPEKVSKLAAEMGARDHAVFGGQITEAGGFIRRSMARNTAPELRDLRDWDAITDWAHAIGAALDEGQSGSARQH